MSEDSSATEVSLSKPTIFEIVSHQAVDNVFKPAWMYVVKILVQKYPEKFTMFYHYAEEIYLIFHLVVQQHYLRRFGASISENFYFLKRVNVSNGHVGNLSKKLQRLSLLELVLWPYIKSKIDQTFERLQDQNIRANDGTSQKIATRIFLAVYPYVHFTIQCIFSAYQFGYTLKLLKHHSPIFHALKMQLVRASTENLRGLPLQSFSTSKSFWQMVHSLPGYLMDKTIHLATIVMPAIIFFLQFIEWWYSRDHEITSSLTNLPVPPPPAMPKVSNRGCGLPPHPLQCPLCHNVRSNMAALVSSGFVYCYPCIHQYISENGCCPVTNIPSCLDQIVRIYSVHDS